jgi:hypothetical protein
MEVYIDIPLYLNLILSSNQLDFGELDEAGEALSIDVYIRSNIKSWKISAKATYASLTWGAEPEGSWVAPALGSTLTQIPYKVSFADFNPTQVLFPLSTLPINMENTLYTFNRITSSGEGIGTDRNREKFTFTVQVDPRAPSDFWEAGKYQDSITLTVTAQ